MGAEHDPSDADDLPGAAFFFPEAAAGGGGILDHETVLIVERRVRVMALYRRGNSMRAIAREVGCSLGTVHADVHAVLEGYKRLAARDVREHRADALQRLAHLEAEVVADLERSRGEAVDTSTSRRATAAGGTDASTVRRRTKYGDPRLHALLQSCWDRRCRLLGLLGRDDLRAAGPPPVKLVAGLDPMELV